MTSVVQARPEPWIAMGPLASCMEIWPGDLAGELRGALGSSVGDEDGGCSLLDEVARGEVGHLARADDEDGLALQAAEILRARSTATDAMETEELPIRVSVRTRLATAKARCRSGSSAVEMAPAWRAME